MLKRKSGEAGWRSLCDSTVTVYRWDGLTRQVLEKVYFDDSLSESVTAGVESAGHGFLLVVPGAFDISPGDKVIRGLGPALEGWEKLNSADVPGLGIVKTVAARYLVDRVSHVEVRG